MDILTDMYFWGGVLSGFFIGLGVRIVIGALFKRPENKADDRSLAEYRSEVAP